MEQKRKRFIAQAFLLVAALCMILTGLHRQEQATVLQKATHICLECIGVG